MNIAIYGSGGAGKEVFDLLQETPEERAKWDEIIFIDDTVPSGEYWSCRRFTFEDFRKTFGPEEVRIVIAVGEPKFREDLYNRVKEAGGPRRRRGPAGRGPGFPGNHDGGEYLREPPEHDRAQLRGREALPDLRERDDRRLREHRGHGVRRRVLLHPGPYDRRGAYDPFHGFRGAEGRAAAQDRAGEPGAGNG